MSLPFARSAALLLFTILGAWGCASSSVEPGDWNTVVDTAWTLHKMDGRAPLTTRDRHAGVEPPTLDLTDDGRVIGFAGVNRFFGTYEATPDGTIRFAAIGSTRMFRDHPPGLMQQENQYFQTLDEIDGYRLRDEQLVLTSGRKARLVYDPPPLPGDGDDAAKNE